MVKGMDGASGRWLDELAHLRQSVRDILTTPIGSRVMLRHYGSDLFKMIDRPVNAALSLDIYAAIVEALWRFEPRLDIERVSLAKVAGAGRIAIDLSSLPAPEVVEPLEYEAIKAALGADLTARCAADGLVFTALLESDPAIPWRSMAIQPQARSRAISFMLSQQAPR